MRQCRIAIAAGALGVIVRASPGQHWGFRLALPLALRRHNRRKRRSKTRSNEPVKRWKR